MSFLPGWDGGFGVTGATANPLTLTYIGVHTSTTDGTSYTFSSANIGTAASDRLVIVLCGGREDDSDDGVLSSITIGGITGSVISPTPTAGGRQTIGIGRAVVPSGTTGNIVLGFNSTLRNCIAYVWTLTGYTSATPHDTYGTNADASGSTTTPALDIPAGGVAVFMGMFNTGSDEAITWESATEAAETYLDGENAATASKTSETLLSNWTETITCGDSGNTGSVAASWV